MRIVVGVTGATGTVLAERFLRAVRPDPGVETHLVVSRWARATLRLETGMDVGALAALADVNYGPRDQSAAISSGSFPVDGMVVLPCSMKTLAAIRAGYADDLVSRAADVTLKERRKLVLVPRETPLSEIHLDNMLALSRMGVVILPPVLTFYNHPACIEDMVDHVVSRVLDQFGIDAPRARRWSGLPGPDPRPGLTAPQEPEDLSR